MPLASWDWNLFCMASAACHGNPDVAGTILQENIQQFCCLLNVFSGFDLLGERTALEHNQLVQSKTCRIRYIDEYAA